MLESGVEQWKVGELASATGLTVRTLHHYDRRGLLVPAQRTVAGHRLYGRQDVRRLYRIVALRQLGLRLDEIASVLDEGQPDLIETVRRHLARVELELERQGRLRDRLVAILGSLERAQEPSVDEFIDVVEAMTVIDLSWLDSDIDDWQQRVRGVLVDFEVGQLRCARIVPNQEWETEQRANGIADAFAELGLLSADEAAAWRAHVVSEVRCAAEARTPPQAGERTRRQASEHLARLLAAVPVRAAPIAVDQHPAQLVFMRALEALETVGAVGADDVAEWHERLAERVGEQSPRERAQRTLQSNCSAVQLLRVMAGPREALHDLTVTTAELYADGVVVRWHLPVALSPAQRALARRERRLLLDSARREALPDFALSDDVGTSYQPLRDWPLGLGLEHADEDDQVINWHSVFAPAVPPKATRLELIDGSRRHFVLRIPNVHGSDG